MLFFTSGPATVIDPSYIEFLDQPAGMMDGVKAVRVSDDHRVFLQGEFGGFRIYVLVKHPRAEVVPMSVQRISETHFRSLVRFEMSPDVISEHEVVFRAPILPFEAVRAHTYGLFPDSFEFIGAGRGTECFPCHLSFILGYAENAPHIPLDVRYIGVAKAAGREAQDRLGEGHEKLQRMLQEENRRPSRQQTSIVLYRPSRLEPEVLSFADVIEAIEATMIQYFKPRPLNVARIDFPHDSPELAGKIRAIGSHSIVTELTAPEGTTLASGIVPGAARHVIRVALP